MTWGPYAGSNKSVSEKDAWPLLDLIAVLTWPDVVRLKAVENGELIGFVAGDPRPSEGASWVATIGVDRATSGAALGAPPACLRRQDPPAAYEIDRANVERARHLVV